ncbi:MAG TPA: DUF433 domain-containing protein [Chthonomonadaceae bacterium]|nr:DUF433 domain-containing protein [Chthonomonadaceae bacterium]
MQLEEYFEFLAPDDIRLKGTRIGIESVLYEYIHRAQTPEAIAERFPSLTLEQIYATILYYLHDRETAGAYLADYLEYTHRARKEFEENMPAEIAALHARIAEQRAARIAKAS